MDNILIVNNKENYFYNLEPACVSPYQFASLDINAIKIFEHLGFKSVPKIFLNRSILDASKIIFTEYGFDYCLYTTVKKYIKDENMYLYLMNLVNPYSKQIMELFPNRTYTFDQKDAARYGIGYRHFPYSSHIQISSDPYEYDTIFLGKEKGRLNEVRKAANMFEQCGLHAKIMILNCQDLNYNISHYISYTKYLQYIAKSRSILEINVKGQTGCTFRYLESLFLKKKLVTNNISLREDPYYDPDNIFILGVDDNGSLADFIKRPYKDNHIDLSDIEFENWIRTW